MQEEMPYSICPVYARDEALTAVLIKHLLLGYDSVYIGT